MASGKLSSIDSKLQEARSLVQKPAAVQSLPKVQQPTPKTIAPPSTQLPQQQQQYPPQEQRHYRQQASPTTAQKQYVPPQDVAPPNSPVEQPLPAATAQYIQQAWTSPATDQKQDQPEQDAAQPQQQPSQQQPSQEQASQKKKHALLDGKSTKTKVSIILMLFVVAIVMAVLFFVKGRGIIRNLFARKNPGSVASSGKTATPTSLDNNASLPLQQSPSSRGPPPPLAPQPSPALHETGAATGIPAPWELPHSAPIPRPNNPHPPVSQQQQAAAKPASPPAPPMGAEATDPPSNPNPKKKPETPPPAPISQQQARPKVYNVNFPDGRVIAMTQEQFDQFQALQKQHQQKALIKLQRASPTIADDRKPPDTRVVTELTV